jgi:hypothetical protein
MKRTETKALENDPQTASNFKSTDNVLEALMQPEQSADYIPGQLKKKSRKKKKRKNISGNQ